MSRVTEPLSTTVVAGSPALRADARGPTPLAPACTHHRQLRRRYAVPARRTRPESACVELESASCGRGAPGRGGVEREIGRDHQRRRSAETANSSGPAPAWPNTPAVLFFAATRMRLPPAAAIAGHRDHNELYACTSSAGSRPSSRVISARRTRSRTPMVMAPSATLKTKNGCQSAEMQIGDSRRHGRSAPDRGYCPARRPAPCPSEIASGRCRSRHIHDRSRPVAMTPVSPTSSQRPRSARRR